MNACPYCSSDGQQMFHGGVCPRVKSIEYYPWGGIKKVEFHGGAPTNPFWPSVNPTQWTTVEDVP